MTHHQEDPTDALEVLGNEIRMTILRELANTDRALSFTELHERVGIRDTGMFNYHLTRLCAYFVRQTEDGYELGHAGTRVIAATDTDVIETDTSMSESEVCPVCGNEDCGTFFHIHLTPPRV